MHQLRRINSSNHRYTIQILLYLSIHFTVTTKFLSDCFIVSSRRGCCCGVSNFLIQPIVLPSSFSSSSSNKDTGREEKISILPRRSYFRLAVETDNDSDQPTIFDSMNINNKNNLIKNFRKVSGFEHLYRSASTDALGDLINNDDSNSNGNGNASPLPLVFINNKNSPEYIILNDIGLILDLRSPSERNELKAQKWMSSLCIPSSSEGGGGGKKFTITTFRRNQNNNSDSSRNGSSELRQNYEKQVYRLDVLSPTRLFKYLSKNWISSLSPIERARYTYNLVFDSNGLHEMRMDILNDRGLKGLYEAIIETSQEELCASLQAIVEHFESNPRKISETSDVDGNNRNYKGVLVHCVQGKDRYV